MKIPYAIANVDMLAMMGTHNQPTNREGVTAMNPKSRSKRTTGKRGLPQHARLQPFTGAGEERTSNNNDKTKLYT